MPSASSAPSCASTASAARHQSSGSCSVHPGRGIESRVAGGGAVEHPAVVRYRDSLDRLVPTSSAIPRATRVGSRVPAA